MRRIKWHETRAGARKHLEQLGEFQYCGGFHVFKWKFTKRKKPFFVGTELEWLNV